MSLNQILLQASPLPSNLPTVLPYKDVVFQSVLTDQLTVTGGTSFGDVQLKSIGLFGSGADTQVLPGEDVAPAIESVLAGGAKQIIIYQGTYAVKSSISFNGYSGVVIKGSGRDVTILQTDAGVSAWDCQGASDEFNCVLQDMTVQHSTSASSNTGTYGIRFGFAKTWILSNIKFRYFETGMLLADVSFYNSFYSISCEDCSSKGIHITFGANDRCNSNAFFGCKIINNGGASVYITRGNENHFFGCHIENWKTYGFVAAGNLADNNGMYGGRLESNDQSPTGFILFDTNAKNNFMYNPYVSGNDIASNTNPVTNNGSGSWYEFGTYIGSVGLKTRDILTAGNFLTFARTGSGDASSILTLNDSYTPSGSPNTLNIITERASGNFLTGTRGGNRYLQVSSQGSMDLGRNMGLGTLQQADQTIALNIISSAAGSSWDSRILRGSGANGNVTWEQKGTGQTRILVNTTSVVQCMTSSGNVGLGAFTGTSPGARIHLREAESALSIFEERFNTAALSIGDPLVNQYYRLNSVNAGNWTASYQKTAPSQSTTQDLSYFTAADGGTLTRRFRIYASGITEHLFGIQTPANQCGLQFTGTWTSSVDYSLGLPVTSSNTSVGQITVTNLEDVAAFSDASKTIAITNNFVSLTSVLQCQVVQANTAANSCIVVKTVTANSGFFTIALLNAGGASSGAGKTIQITFQVLTG
jgi:hypothetical protein